MLGDVWPLVSAETMRALDRHTIQTLGIPGELLMECAGRAVAAAGPGHPPSRPGTPLEPRFGGGSAHRAISPPSMVPARSTARDTPKRVRRATITATARFIFSEDPPGGRRPTTLFLSILNIFIKIPLLYLLILF